MKKRHEYFEKMEGTRSEMKNTSKKNKKELKDFKIKTDKYHKRSMKIKITEYDIKDR
jgi:hypothetical protein